MEKLEMNKFKVSFKDNLIFILIFLFVYSNYAICLSQQEENNLEEFVDVINVEIPCRVYFQGKLVKNLKKTDFILYEAGRQIEINGFNEHRRKINIRERNLELSIKNKIVYKPRLFVFIFNITSFHLKLENGINYLFDKVLKNNDRYIVLLNTRIIPEKEIRDLNMEKTILKTIIKEESKIMSHEQYSIFSSIKGLKDRCKQELAFNGSLELGRPVSSRSLLIVLKFLEEYLRYLRQYRYLFIIPSLDKYYNFAQFLSSFKKQIWVINFFQLEKFPKLKIDSRLQRRINEMISLAMTSTLGSENLSVYARMLSRTLNEIDKNLNVANNNPIEEIGKIFLNVNATFHTILLNPIESEAHEDLYQKKISSDIENSLRRITELTGGELLSSNNLEESLNTISEKEDVFYLLTYAPTNNEKLKIHLKVKYNDYTVVYNDFNYPGFFKKFLKKNNKKTQKIVLDSIEFENNKMSFLITGFKVIDEDKEKIGKILLNIKIVNNKDNVVFDERKAYKLKNKIIKMLVAFKELKKGDYFAIVTITDLLTNETKFFQRKFVIK